MDFTFYFQLNFIYHYFIFYFLLLFFFLQRKTQLMRKLAPVQVSTSDTILGGGEVLNFFKNTL